MADSSVSARDEDIVPSLWTACSGVARQAPRTAHSCRGRRRGGRGCSRAVSDGFARLFSTEFWCMLKRARGAWRTSCMDGGRVRMAGTAGRVRHRRWSLSNAVGVMVGLVFAAVAFGPPAAAQAVGELSYDACFGAGAGCTVVAGGPLTGADSVAVSPNGGSVYVTGKGIHPGDGAVAHFFVGAQGRLAYDGCVSDDGSGGTCADVPGSGSPLAGAERGGGESERRLGVHRERVVAARSCTSSPTRARGS